MATSSLRPQQQERSRSFRTPSRTRSNTNVGEIERWASIIGGSALVLAGLARRSLGGLALSAVGGSLLYRGLSGHCPTYDALGVDTAHRTHSPASSIPAGHGVRLETTVTINRSPEELYRFWREFENLPRFMQHVRSVRRVDDKRSHWVADAPLGTSVEWDAATINERDNELIAWRSVDGSSVDTAGSVHFERAPDGRGTVVRVNLKYDPPAGKVGAGIAGIFGKDPSQMIREDLRRFKQMVETGEIARKAGKSFARFSP